MGVERRSTYTMSATRRRYDLLHKRLEQFTRMLHAIGEGDVRALHRTRVASRRLREILPVLQLKPQAADRFDLQVLRRVASAIDKERTQARDRLIEKLPTRELARIARKLEDVGS